MAEPEALDIYCTTGLRRDMAEVTGYTALAHRLMRGLWTPEDKCPWWPAWRGTDIRRFLLSKISPRIIEAVIRKQCLKDEQVRTCKATASEIDFDTRTMTVTVAVVAEDIGPFTFSMSVTQAAIDLVDLQTAS